MRHRVLVTGIGLTCIVLSGACESEDDRPRPAASAEPAPQDDTRSTAGGGGKARARVIDTDFLPATIEISRGTTVRWTQVGDQPHSVTAADGSFDSSPECGPLDSDRCLGMDDTFAHAFETPGTFVYYCRVHGLPDGTGMTATVVVR
jgi:plastocyanin